MATKGHCVWGCSTIYWNCELGKYCWVWWLTVLGALPSSDRECQEGGDWHRQHTWVGTRRLDTKEKRLLGAGPKCQASGGGGWQNFRKGKKRRGVCPLIFAFNVGGTVRWEGRACGEALGRQVLDGRASFQDSWQLGFNVDLKMTLWLVGLKRDPSFLPPEGIYHGTLGLRVDGRTQKAKDSVWTKVCWTLPLSQAAVLTCVLWG